MTENKVINQKNIGTVAFFASVVLLISLIGSLFQTPEYATNAKTLIIFHQNDIDPYTATKTTEYITSVLGEVIYSNAFIDSVIKNDTTIQKEFSSSLEKRKRQWHKTVETKVDTTKGIIEFDVYHQDKVKSNQLSQAITLTITTQHQFYHGLGNKINIKTIDQPTTSDGWAKPRILLNSILGLIAGWILGMTLIIIYPRQNLLELFFMRLRHLFFKDETFNLDPDLEVPESPNQQDSNSDYRTYNQ